MRASWAALPAWSHGGGVSRIRPTIAMRHAGRLQGGHEPAGAAGRPGVDDVGTSASTTNALTIAWDTALRRRR
jgi:hypothetical protein